MAENEEKKKAKDKEEELPQSSGNKRLFIMLGLMGVTMIGAVIVLLLLLTGTPSEGKKNGPEEEVVFIEDKDGVLNGAMFTLEPFVINLQAADEFLLLACTIEFYDFVLPENLDKMKPRIRDAIISVVSSKTPDEVMAIDGKEKLRLQLLAAINKVVSEENLIVDVYFLDFTVQ